MAKTFYIKAHYNNYNCVTHFSRYIEADTIEEAKIIFEETYGWNNRIDIIEERKTRT